MKPYLQKTALVFALTGMLGTTAFAGVDKVTYTPGTGVMNVTVSGTSKDSGEAVGLMILKQGVTEDAYNGADDAARAGMLEYAREAYSNSGKEWSFTLQVDGTESDERLLRVREAGGGTVTVLPLFGNDDAIAAVNSADTANIAAVLEKYAPFLDYKTTDAYKNIFASASDVKRQFVYDNIAKTNDFNENTKK